MTAALRNRSSRTLDPQELDAKGELRNEFLFRSRRPLHIPAQRERPNGGTIQASPKSCSGEVARMIVVPGAAS
jgi:hypothetical protein